MDYLCNGFVVSRPDIFWMMKVVRLAEPEGKLAWFCRIAIGDLRELFETLPARLPYIAFCRRGESRLRVYPMERFIHLANKFGGRTVTIGG
jgi:hypothetical protein